MGEQIPQDEPEAQDHQMQEPISQDEPEPQGQQMQDEPEAQGQQMQDEPEAQDVQQMQEQIPFVDYEEQDVQPEQMPEQLSSPAGSNILWYILIAFIVIAGVLGGVLAYRRFRPKKAPKVRNARKQRPLERGQHDSDISKGTSPPFKKLANNLGLVGGLGAIGLIGAAAVAHTTREKWLPLIRGPKKQTPKKDPEPPQSETSTSSWPIALGAVGLGLAAAVAACVVEYEDWKDDSEDCEWTKKYWHKRKPSWLEYAQACACGTWDRMRGTWDRMSVRIMNFF